MARSDIQSGPLPPASLGEPTRPVWRPGVPAWGLLALTASAALYVGSCFAPSYHTFGADHNGWWCLLLGWLWRGPLWCANPLFLLGWVFLICRGYRAGLVLGAAALLLAVRADLPLQPHDVVLWGCRLWQAGMALFVAGAALLHAHDVRSERDLAAADVRRLCASLTDRARRRRQRSVFLTVRDRLMGPPGLRA